MTREIRADIGSDTRSTLTQLYKARIASICAIGSLGIPF